MSVSEDIGGFEANLLTETAPGTSGSWVVRESFLCGMVMAVSETEPYALIMTAEHLFRNIKSRDKSIRNIELYAGHITTDLIPSHHGGWSISFLTIVNWIISIWALVFFMLELVAVC